MPAAEHWILLDDDVRCWNQWRAENPEIHPDLSGISLSRRSLSAADLNRCNLSGTHLNQTDLSNCDLERANLSSASLLRANLQGANLNRAMACGANFAGSNLCRSTITDADLSNCHLTEAQLESANLSRTDISKANLYGANLRTAKLKGAKLAWSSLTRVDLSGADLSLCDLTGTSFIEADLTGANLWLANLRFARFIDSHLDRANLSGCRVYGVSVWNVSSEAAIESDLVITPPDEVAITVDSLAIAQFVYLLLDSKDIRKTIDTVSSKVVLILGRFTADRMAVLNAIRDALRARDYLPLLFDFEGPSKRDVTETVSTLAHLARFVIADITDARSIPQELMAIVPNLPSVPVQPLLLSSEQEYGMFEHFRRYPWVLKTFEYSGLDALVGSFDHRIVQPAEAMANAQSGWRADRRSAKK